MGKILAFSGSLSSASVNMKLIYNAEQELQENGDEVMVIDLKDYPLPVYDPEVQVSEFPKEALELFKLMQDHPVWIIASPEHNSSISVCLKNLIDWISRSPENKTNMKAFAGRIIGLISASPSALGGSRGLRHLREILSSMGAIVIPSQTCIASAYNAFDDKNQLINPSDKKSLTATLQQLVNISQKFNS